MNFAHRLALSTLLDRLGDLIELIHWSGLAKFMNVSVPLTEIKALLYSNYSMIFGEHMWDKATELVQKCHQSVFLLAKQEHYYPQRRGFRSLAKLIVEIEGQLNTCIDVLKVIAIAAVQDLGEADKRANGLAYALSNEEGPPPINSVTTYDPTIQSLATVQKIRQDARKLSVYICRSLSDVLDAAARLDDPDGCPRGLEDHKSMEEDEDRSQLAKRWFPKEYREGEPAYIDKPFGALECRIVEMAHRLERLDTNLFLFLPVATLLIRSKLFLPRVPIPLRMKSVNYMTFSGFVYWSCGLPGYPTAYVWAETGKYGVRLD